jgi:CDP-alcohol phosphatidyltransferase
MVQVAGRGSTPRATTIERNQPLHGLGIRLWCIVDPSQSSSVGLRGDSRVQVHFDPFQRVMMVFSIFSLMLSLALLVAPSRGLSFVPKLSSSALPRRRRFRLPVSAIRGGSSSDDLSAPGSDSSISLPNSFIAPAIPDSPQDIPLPRETMETGSLVSPPTPPVVVSEEEILRKSFLGPNASPPGYLRRKFPDFPWHRVPNWLTYFRCVAIPLFVGVFYRPHSNIAASCLFAVASATDFLDGYLARKWDIASAFGAFLDPVVSGALLLYLPMGCLP